MTSVIVDQYIPDAIATGSPARFPSGWRGHRPDTRALVMPWAAGTSSGTRAAELTRDFADVPSPDGPTEFSVEVVGIRQETPSLRTLVLRRTDGQPLGHRPGQFVRLYFPADGPYAATVDRAYSISSSPFDSGGDGPTFTVCVKKVADGRVSPWIHRNLTVGTVLEAQGPLGGFHLPDVDRRARYLLLAAGAGITPVLSMVRSLAALSAHAGAHGRRAPDAVVIYHCRRPGDFAFATELTAIAEAHPGIRVSLSLGSAGSRRGARAVSRWTGPVGRLCPDVLESLAEDACGRRVFACGPSGYLAGAREVAESVGVPPNAFHEESFDDTAGPRAEDVPGTAGTGAGNVPDTVAPVPAEQPGQPAVTFARSGIVAPVAVGETILEAGRRAGVALRSNCGTGVCGSCAVQKISGEVDMRHQGGLRQRDIDAGRILACCSRPVTAHDGTGGTAGAGIVVDA
ncbi:MAG: flavin reductase family protein [Mycobacteriaceae bacterium]|uniref:flavin reductase family protein n=1 Tax=Corynebacterium sp. TaxID=1720 RepID=UPI003F9B07C7